MKTWQKIAVTGLMAMAGSVPAHDNPDEHKIEITNTRTRNVYSSVYRSYLPQVIIDWRIPALPEGAPAHRGNCCSIGISRLENNLFTDHAGTHRNEHRAQGTFYMGVGSYDWNREYTFHAFFRENATERGGHPGNTHTYNRGSFKVNTGNESDAPIYPPPEPETPTEPEPETPTEPEPETPITPTIGEWQEAAFIPIMAQSRPDGRDNKLWFANRGDDPVRVRITGWDRDGREYSGFDREIPAKRPTKVLMREIEEAIGNGEGYWSLTIESTGTVHVVALSVSADGTAHDTLPVVVPTEECSGDPTVESD